MKKNMTNTTNEKATFKDGVISAILGIGLVAVVEYIDHHNEEMVDKAIEYEERETKIKMELINDQLEKENTWDKFTKKRTKYRIIRWFNNWSVFWGVIMGFILIYSSFKKED